MSALVTKTTRSTRSLPNDMLQVAQETFRQDLEHMSLALAAFDPAAKWHIASFGEWWMIWDLIVQSFHSVERILILPLIKNEELTLELTENHKRTQVHLIEVRRVLFALRDAGGVEARVPLVALLRAAFSCVDRRVRAHGTIVLDRLLPLWNAVKVADRKHALNSILVDGYLTSQWSLPWLVSTLTEREYLAFLATLPSCFPYDVQLMFHRLWRPQWNSRISPFLIAMYDPATQSPLTKGPPHFCWPCCGYDDIDPLSAGCCIQMATVKPLKLVTNPAAALPSSPLKSPGMASLTESNKGPVKAPVAPVAATGFLAGGKPGAALLYTKQPVPSSPAATSKLLETPTRGAGVGADSNTHTDTTFNTGVTYGSHPGTLLIPASVIKNADGTTTTTTGSGSSGKPEPTFPPMSIDEAAFPALGHHKMEPSYLPVKMEPSYPPVPARVEPTFAPVSVQPAAVVAVVAAASATPAPAYNPALSPAAIAPPKAAVAVVAAAVAELAPLPPAATKASLPPPLIPTATLLGEEAPVATPRLVASAATVTTVAAPVVTPEVVAAAPATPTGKQQHGSHPAAATLAASESVGPGTPSPRTLTNERHYGAISPLTDFKVFKSDGTQGTIKADPAAADYGKVTVVETTVVPGEAVEVAKEAVGAPAAPVVAAVPVAVAATTPVPEVVAAAGGAGKGGKKGKKGGK